jgi:hypothetical protein
LLSAEQFATKWNEIAIEVEIDAEAWSDSVLLEK